MNYGNFAAEDLGYITKGLNPAQKEAVTSPPDHRLILAGAGSGKTSVLVRRVAWLVAAENVSPHSILAVTFTNKAAGEMRSRLEKMINMPARALWVGTFHGIAHRMLRMHWQEAGLPQNFQVLDSDDQKRFVKRLLKTLDLPEDRWPPKTITGWINAQKEEARRPDSFGDSGDFSQRQLVRIYAAYQNACNQQGLVDFSELLLRAYELCRDHIPIQTHYRNRFRHILVDEFQDTNTLQYRWLKDLAGTQGRLFAVGDDDQSVYSWRGAKVENMQLLMSDYPRAETIRLEQNYRSTGTILKAANQLISKNDGRLGKNLWTDAGDGELIQLYAAFNDLEEREQVVNRIRENRDRGVPLVDMAILYRSNAQSRILEEGLIRARIPYKIYGGLRFFERMEVKDALAYMRLIANNGDDPAFERVINTPARGIGNTTVERLREVAKEGGISLWQAAQNGTSALGRSAGKVIEFMALIESLAKEAKVTPLGDMVERVIEVTALRAHYSKEKGEQAEARLENLDELINAAKTFENPDEEGADPLTELITHAALEAGERQAGEGEDCVQLMTLHSAKGLEFPLVFLVGLEEGLFPHMRAVQEGNLEEERRLCYVGLTRAKQQLFISYAELRRLHGQEQITMPSRFIKEIPEECIQEIRPRKPLNRGAFAHSGGGSGYSGKNFGGRAQEGYNIDKPKVPKSWNTPVNANLSGLNLGSRVLHQRFGEGTVTAFDGEGERMRVEVNFRDVGSKWLILALAKLQPL